MMQDDYQILFLSRADSITVLIKLFEVIKEKQNGN